ncbi:MAG: hypothetical protein ACREGF_00495, partial [Candidatus Saccharimonadales bacterium]
LSPLHLVEPTKILLEKTLTSVPAGHKPAIVIGLLVNDWPLPGVVMVAGCDGGGAEIVPCKPVEPLPGPGLGGSLKANAGQLKDKPKITMTSIAPDFKNRVKNFDIKLI